MVIIAKYHVFIMAVDVATFKLNNWKIHQQQLTAEPERIQNKTQAVFLPSSFLRVLAGAKTVKFVLRGALQENWKGFILREQEWDQDISTKCTDWIITFKIFAWGQKEKTHMISKMKQVHPRDGKQLMRYCSWTKKRLYSDGGTRVIHPLRTINIPTKFQCL